tara:strand:- start:437 stop:541 length:105 start_codon:yes stop_codon:yes gene_type:complete
MVSKWRIQSGEYRKIFKKIYPNVEDMFSKEKLNN